MAFGLPEPQWAASQPWLQPDILDCLRELKERGGCSDVVIAPIGFVSDHMEILFDLDTQASQLCEELGFQMVRAGTVGTHPRFIRMIRELIGERLDQNKLKLALGMLGPRPDVCAMAYCRRQAVKLEVTRPTANGMATCHATVSSAFSAS